VIIIAARRYVSPRERALTPEEAETRKIAYTLKERAFGEESFTKAAGEMAALIDPPCVLVPVPASDGNLEANGRLALLIAEQLGPRAKVRNALYRIHQIVSQCTRHRNKLGPLPAEAHGIRRRKGIMFNVNIPVYFVDNVVTSGNTLEACRLAISIGRGLVFADAYRSHQA